MNKTELFLRQHSSTILSVTGVVGVVTTSVLAVKATPKALSLIEEAKNNKGEDLTTIEVVKVAWKPYIPAVISGVATIGCIVGVNWINSRNQASLMSAYALLDQSYREYRNKVNDIYGENADINVKQEIVKSKMEDGTAPSEGKTWFFDFQSARFFESTMEEVKAAEEAFLELMRYRGFACLNEYYELLGIPTVEFGWQEFWWDVENNDPYDCHELEFHYEKTIRDDGLECYLIDTNIPPATDRYM